MSLAQEYEAQLTLVHVLAESETGDLVTPQQLIPATESRLRSLVAEEAALWCKPQVVVGQGSPGETIVQIAEHRHADIIVLGLHRKGGVPGAATHLSSAVAHTVVAHASCPVLTVRT